MAFGVELLPLNLSLLMCHITRILSVECFIGEVQAYHTESQDKGISCILTFDLNTHVFGMITLHVPGLSWVLNKLTTIQGSLALISCESCLIRYGEMLLGLWF